MKFKYLLTRAYILAATYPAEILGVGFAAFLCLAHFELRLLR